MKNVAEAWVQNGTSGVLWWTDKMIFPTSEMPSHSQLSQINQSNRTKSVYSLNYNYNIKTLAVWSLLTVGLIVLPDEFEPDSCIVTNKNNCKNKNYQILGYHTF